ncbi:MAG TPA: hypothetical protein VJ731_06780 [Terriglobales bacterium]|nr:hypothetical protein [Terriglobales bacterium]
MKTAYLLLIITLLPVVPLQSEAQHSKSPLPATAPIPSQIPSARKIFVSNAGGEDAETVIHGIALNGGPDRAYNQFYAAVNDLARYELVSSPADADLVFEIGWAFTAADLKQWQQFNPVSVLPPVLGQLRLRLIDPKTHITLWTVHEYVRGAELLGNRDKNFDLAMNTVVSRLKALLQPVANTGGPGAK